LKLLSGTTSSSVSPRSAQNAEQVEAIMANIKLSPRSNASESGSPQQVVSQPVRASSTPFKSLSCVATLDGHTHKIFGLAIGAGKLFSCSYDCSIKVWDLRTLKCIHTIEKAHPHPVYCLLATDKQLWSGGWDNKVKVWDLNTFQPIDALSGHLGFISCLASNGTNVYSGSFDGSIQIWDIKTRKTIGTLLKENTGGKHSGGQAGAITSLCICEDQLVSGAQDFLIKFWTGLLCRRTLQGHTDWIWSLTSLGKTVFSGSRDNTIRAWNFDSGECLKVFGDHKAQVCKVIIIGGKWIGSSSSDNTMKVWDPNTYACVQTMSGEHTANIYTLAGGHGSTIFSGAWDKTIKVWQ